LLDFRCLTCPTAKFLNFIRASSDFRMAGFGACGLNLVKNGPGRPPMLAARRFRCLLKLPAPLSLAVWLLSSSFLSLPLMAQVQGAPLMQFQGVPASGIGGTVAGFSAARPNTNSGNGASYFGCCASFFFPSSFSPLVPYSSPATGHRSGRHHHRRDEQLAGVYDPVYIPYAVPAGDSEGATDGTGNDLGDTGTVDDGSAELSPGSTRAGRRQVAQGPPEQQPDDDRGGGSGSDAEADSGSEAGAGPAADAITPEPPEPVVAQPTTVLVFKDGHRSEVVNYAIVGDTLFDFSGDRTHKIPIAELDLAATQKANDASGVEFKLPPTSDGSPMVKAGAN